MFGDAGATTRSGDTVRVLGGRQIEEGQEIARLEMRAGFLEVGLALGVDQAGGAVGEHAGRIGGGAVPLRLDEDRPTGCGGECAKHA